MLHCGMKWHCFIWKGGIMKRTWRCMKHILCLRALLVKHQNIWSTPGGVWNEAFSGFMFFCLFSKAKKTWSLKRHRFIRRQACFIIPPFQMKQLHVVPLWSICCSQIWSTSVLRRLYKEELLNKIPASQTDWLFCFLPHNLPSKTARRSVRKAIRHTPTV